MPSIKAPPRSDLLGLLADLAESGKSKLNAVQVPVLGGLGDLALGDAPSLLNDMSYQGLGALVKGGNAATGGIGTFRPDPRILDVAGVLPASPAVTAVKKAAPVVGRALSPQAEKLLMDYAVKMGGVKPITAYHGTPHKFDKFSLDKIGTGEGAQVYGHGLYFADNPEVANQYRINLSYNPDEMKVGGKQINDLYDQIQNRANRLPPSAASSEYEKMQILEDLMGNQNPSDLQEPVKTMLPATQKWFEQTVKPSFQTYGNFYKVDIPDEAVAKMLLWDKPLSEQPESVKKGIEGIYSQYVRPDVETPMYRNGQLIDSNSPDFSLGREIASNGYDSVLEKATKSLQDAMSKLPESHPIVRAKKATLEKVQSLAGNTYKQDVVSTIPSMDKVTAGDFLRQMGLGENQSNVLKQMGIPGIRYLDQGSRDAGQGSMNTVLFDDSLVKILERNGVPLGLLNP